MVCFWKFKELWLGMKPSMIMLTQKNETAIKTKLKPQEY